MNLKYKILATLFFLLANLSQAQDVYILGGVNFSKLGQLKGNSLGNLDRTYKPGFHLGSAIDIRLNDHFAFEPGILFSLKREYHESTFYMLSLDHREFNSTYKFKSDINEYYLVPLRKL